MPNPGTIEGTHHLTFCVGGAQEDYDFHVRTLGLKSVKKTGHMLCVESGFPSYGVASEIMALTCEYAFDYLEAPPARVTGAEVPTPYAQKLEELSFPQEDTIVNYAAKLLRVA